MEKGNNTVEVAELTAEEIEIKRERKKYAKKLVKRILFGIFCAALALLLLFSVFAGLIQSKN